MKSDQIISEFWAEIAAAILLLIGFLIALLIPSPFLNYFVIVLAGLLAGRVLYEKHLIQPIFPFILIAVGFLFGFMLGAISANKLVITILFFMGLGCSYIAHKKGYVGFFKSGGFIK